MQAITLRQLFEQLTSEGLVSVEQAGRWNEMLQVPDEQADLPWYVKALVGVSAWMAALLLGFFFGAAGLIDSGVSMLFWGVILCAIALALAWRLGASIFWSQLSFAFSLAGQGLLIGGFGTVMNDPSASVMALFVVLLETVLLIIYPDATHRLLSLLGIAGGIVLWLTDINWWDGIQVLIVLSAFATVLVWAGESWFSTGWRSNFRAPLGYGLPLIVCGLSLAALLDLFDISDLFATTLWWVTAAGLGLVLLYLGSQILRSLELPLLSSAGLAILLVLGLLLIPGYQTPGILAAVIVLMTGFWRRNPLLMGIASLFLLVSLSAWYYNLDLTLLVKSYSLMGLGVILLGVRLVLFHGQAARPTTGPTTVTEVSS